MNTLSNVKKQVCFILDKTMADEINQVLPEINKVILSESQKNNVDIDYLYVAFDIVPEIIKSQSSDVPLQQSPPQATNVIGTLNKVIRKLQSKKKHYHSQVVILITKAVHRDDSEDAFREVTQLLQKITTEQNVTFHVIGGREEETNTATLQKLIDSLDTKNQQPALYFLSTLTDYFALLSEWLNNSSLILGTEENLPPFETNSQQNNVETIATQASNPIERGAEHDNGIAHGIVDSIKKVFPNNKPETPQLSMVIPERYDHYDKPWLILHGSSTGTSHTTSPCQDSYAFDNTIDGNWGIAVVCDGAGSCLYSNYGSAFVARETLKFLRNMLKQASWLKENTFPNPALWHEIARLVFSQVLVKLKEYANDAGIDSKKMDEFSSTVIIAIYSTKGLLTAHIGDGRACYRDQHGQWKAMIMPFSAPDGGTAFLPTNFVWQAPSVFIESRIIDEPVTAFALLTDGCEDHTYNIRKEFSFVNKWLDINEPCKEFWEPNYSYYLTEINKKNRKTEDLVEIWQSMLISGKGFANEQDDKTIVFGLLKEIDNDSASVKLGNDDKIRDKKNNPSVIKRLLGAGNTDDKES